MTWRAGGLHAASRQTFAELPQPVGRKTPHGAELGNERRGSELGVEALCRQEPPEAHVSKSAHILTCTAKSSLAVSTTNSEACMPRTRVREAGVAEDVMRPVTAPGLTGARTGHAWRLAGPVIQGVSEDTNKHDVTSEDGFADCLCLLVWRPGRLAMRWARATLKSCASHSATSRSAIACGSQCGIHMVTDENSW